ncbi:L,D-transpeptidase family protein [Rhodanobacter sp. L36]|uniref:L,D-transpeptidase family protein n=1 Tax=Rhodanobacter sp. L36 TaxID=1747221 RepID=UPI001C204EBE|nr:L,D-transpeptidase family protein [Rhodanobacter sp. L36]
MANFGKFANLSPNGWDAATFTQTIGLGKEAHIGLWGGGPSNVDLEVKAADPTVCVVHEEPRPKGWAGWRHFLITSLTDGSTKINAFLPGTTAAWATMDVNVSGTAGARLVFFPGERLSGHVTEGTIYVIGGHGEQMKAAGGPNRTGSVAHQGGHSFEPTPAGHYVLGPRQHVTTTSWPSSVIPWGAPLRLNTANEVEYQDAAGRWRQASGNDGEVTRATISFLQRGNVSSPMSVILASVREMFVDPATGALLASTWMKNDFGVWGWNLRKGGQGTAYWVHTTPATENNPALALTNSHGCIHLIPSERERLEKAGFLKEGVPFEVRPYTETGPP